MRYLKIISLSREKQKNIEKYSLTGLAALLVLFFVVSLIIGYTDNTVKEPLSSEEIIAYAKTFLPGYANEAYGTRLDCSGFTRAVYKNFSVQLSSSSTGQYEKTERVDKENIVRGNLLFFNITGSGISHVAICLDSTNFIHSPGKGREICVNSLEQTYWKSRFISAGRVNFK